MSLCLLLQPALFRTQNSNADQCYKTLLQECLVAEISKNHGGVRHDWRSV